ncbi:MAG: iron ABC transporter permease [Puniceicoccaceae bacterium]
MNLRSAASYSFLTLFLVLFGAFFFWPIFIVIRGGFATESGGFTLTYVIEVFRNPVYREGLLNALGVGLFTTLLSLLISLPLAYVADRYEFFGKKWMGNLILLPIMLPPFVGAIGIRQILGQYGILNSVLESVGILGVGETIDWLGQGRFWGIVILSALGLYPILYLNLIASFAQIDPAMEEAASNLGANRWRRFWKVTLPLVGPGMFAGCTIVFIWSFTELGVPLVFDYDRMISVQIFKGIKELGGNPFPYAMVGVMLFISAIAYLSGKLVFGGRGHAMMSKASHAGSSERLGWKGQSLCFALFGSVIFLALMPHLTLVLVSFSADWYDTMLPQHWTLQNYELALGSSLTVPSIKNSLFYSVLATILNVSLGIGVAFILVRTTVWGRSLLDTCVMLPLAVPGIVIAFGYLAMTQKGQFFEFLNPIDNPTVLLIIAYAMRKIPFVVRAAVAGLQQSSVTYEEAAQNLGCPPIKSAFNITHTLITASLIAGAMLAFSQCMLEVSDSLMLAQKQQFYPITKAIFELLGFLGDGRFIASALGVWAMVFLALTIFGANRILGKKLGSVFRL